MRCESARTGRGGTILGVPPNPTVAHCVIGWTYVAVVRQFGAICYYATPCERKQRILKFLLRLNF